MCRVGVNAIVPALAGDGARGIDTMGITFAAEALMPGKPIRNLRASRKSRR